jgi:hypothetical protein
LGGVHEDQLIRDRNRLLGVVAIISKSKDELLAHEATGGSVAHLLAQLMIKVTHRTSSALVTFGASAIRLLTWVAHPEGRQ